MEGKVGREGRKERRCETAEEERKEMKLVDSTYISVLKPKCLSLKTIPTDW